MYVSQFEGDPRATSRRRTSPLVWLAAIVVVIVTSYYFIAKPIAERVITGAGAVVAALMQAVAGSAEMAFDMACDDVRQSPTAREVLGEPLVFAPIEQTEWLDTHGSDQLEFKFAVSGPKGRGVAHVIAVVTETGFEPLSVDITGPGDETVEISPP